MRPVSNKTFLDMVQGEKLPTIIKAQNALDNIHQEKNHQDHFCSESENIDESLEGRDNPGSRHQIAAREIIFESKFDLSTPKIEPRRPVTYGFKTEKPKENIERNKLVSIVLQPITLNGKDPLPSPKFTESDFLLANSGSAWLDSRESNLHINTNLTGNPRVETRVDEIILNTESPVLVVRRYNSGFRLSNRGQNLPIENRRNLPSSSSERSNQNHTEVEINNNGNSQISQQQTNQPASQLQSRTEIKIFLRRSLAFFIALTVISSLLIIVVQKKAPIISLFIGLYIYWIYVLIDNYKEAYNSRREQAQRYEDFFGSFTAISAIFAQVCLNLKVLEITSYSFPAFIPFAIMTIVSLCIKKSLLRLRFQKILIKLFYTIQILAITLKLDNFLHWDWKVIFILLWIYLVISCFYFFLYAFSLLAHALLAIFHQYQETTTNLTATSIGLVWYFIYYSLGVFGILHCVGVEEAIQDDNQDLLKNVAWATLCIGFFLFFYTKIFYKSLIEYMLNTDGPSPLMYSRSLSQRNKNKPNSVTFSTEKIEKNFQMISPTYFRVLDSDSPINKSIKSESNQKKQISMLEVKQDVPDSDVISLEKLLQDKRILDKKFSSNKSKREAKVRLQNALSKRRFSEMVRQDKGVKGNLGKVDVAEINAITNKKRRTSQINFISKWSLFKPKERFPERKNTEKFCYICFDKTADAILMKCGHGGICFDCAVTAIKKKNSCLTCRREVVGIYRVNPEANSENIVKSIEYAKINQV